MGFPFSTAAVLEGVGISAVTLALAADRFCHPQFRVVPQLVRALVVVETNLQDFKTRSLRTTK